VVELVVVLVEDRKRLDVVALALALQPGFARCLERRLPVGHHLRRQRHRPGERIVEHAERSQPVHHAAARIGLQRALEGRPVVLQGKGVVVRHRDVEFLLRRGVALDREVDLAELLGDTAGVVSARGQCHAESEEQCGDGDGELRVFGSHGLVSSIGSGDRRPRQAGRRSRDGELTV
jgi:hypothetical protein